MASGAQNFSFGYPTPGPQNPTGQDVLNHVFFLSQGGWKDARESQEFDYIVIGSGFCSFAFCQRIWSQNEGARILVLERGTFFLPEHFQNLPQSYKQVLGGLSETFPWRITAKTWNQPFVKWQHGMIPFFGGRSTVWSGWCPQPDDFDIREFPKETIQLLKEKYFAEAKKLLNVKDASNIDAHLPQENRIYGWLQDTLQKLFNERKERNHDSFCYVIPAPMAVGAPELPCVDFEKYATPGPFMALISKSQEAAQLGKGREIKVVTGCTVENILHEDGKARVLETSRGPIAIKDAKVVLAMGTLPATTLVLNSFPDCTNVGRRFTSHFISAIVARVPLEDYDIPETRSDTPQLSAFYYSGKTSKDKSYHIQLTALQDPDPDKNVSNTQMHMPDVVATATLQQLRTSKSHVVFVCAVLGELDFDNPDNFFQKDPLNPDRTTNSVLQFIANDNDREVWDTMDNATFHVLENVLSPKGKDHVEYWIAGKGNDGQWEGHRPNINQYRVPGMVHEASTLHFGDENDPKAPVNLDYRLRDPSNASNAYVDNVFVTGGGLWPSGPSWNPTMTMVGLAQHLADTLESTVDRENVIIDYAPSVAPFTLPVMNNCGGFASLGHSAF